MKRYFYHTFRLFYAVKSWITGRFTAAGLLALACLVASAVVGLDTNQTLAYQAFTFLLSLIALSVLWSLFSRTSFGARRELPPFATTGEPFSYRILLKNLSKRPQGDLSVLERIEDPRPTLREFLYTPEPGEEKRNPFDRLLGYHRWMWLIRRRQGALVRDTPLSRVAPNGESEVLCEILPARRGYLRLRGLTVARPDPFGLFRSFVDLPIRDSLVILPKRYPLPAVNLPGTRRFQPGGVALASSVGDSEEFMAVRDYRPGDPLRRIHWKSWAKTGKPIVKEYQDEFFVRHALILDTFQKAGHSEVFEEAVSVAASFACTVQTQESLLDLLFVGTEAYCFTAGRGLARTDKMLEILASVMPCTDKPFNSIQPLVMERSPLMSGCICIFLSWDEQRQELIRLLQGLAVPLLVLVVTDRGTTRALDPGPMKGEPAAFRTLQVGRIEEALSGL